MGRFLHILITLLLILSPLSVLGADAVSADTLSQMDALQLLAKSKAADDKCKVLAAGESDELGSYLARAEIAATERTSVQDSQGSIAVGRTLGGSVACDSTTSAEVNDTLDAARRAMAAVEETDTGRRRWMRARDPQLEQQVENRLRLPVTINSYRQQAFAYYLERRCRHLSARQARSFWRDIVRQHRVAMRQNGRKAVVSAVRSAEAEANNTSCGSNSRRIVRAEFAGASTF